MKRSLILLSLLFLSTVSTAQRDIGWDEADSMIRGLNNVPPGIQRMRQLLDLAQFYINKRRRKTDLDSAAIYLNQAKALSKNFYSSDDYGRMLLVEADWVQEKGNKEAGKKLLKEALKILDSGTNRDYVGRAYFRLAQYYDTNVLRRLPSVRQRVVPGISVKYELGMKSDTIKQQSKNISALRQQNTVQQASLQEADTIRNITIVGIVLALIILGLLYRQYRQKQKSNLAITQKNQQLENLLNEKDWLVKEIHHRVKNNLQMVVSLLNAQTEFLTHPSAIDAIKESRERMQAIAIIHQKLYQLDNSTEVSMPSYVNELVDNIKHSFADSKRLQFQVDIADVSLDISQSMPLGLILNEAIINAIKYAYPKNEEGPIIISLKYYGPEKLQLKVADNGKGLPADMDISHSNSLGIQLIRLFSEQLDGELYFINDNGLEITLNFKVFEQTAKRTA